MQSLHEKENDLHPVMEGFTRSSLGKIIQKAKWLLALDRALQTLLPPEFATYCHVMNVNQATLVLGVSSAAIAMRIRFVSSDLIQTLQKEPEWQMIREIQCKVCARTIRY